MHLQVYAVQFCFSCLWYYRVWMLFRHLAVHLLSLTRITILIASHLVKFMFPAAASVMVKIKVAVWRELKRVGPVYTVGKL